MLRVNGLLQTFTPALKCIMLYLTNNSQGVSQLIFEIMKRKKKKQKEKQKHNIPKHSPMVERVGISEL